MAVNWNALAQAPNAGLAFVDAFQRAQQVRQQQALQAQQMAEHQQDRQMQMQQMSAEQAKAALEQNRDRIVMGGRLIQQMNPTDDASWQQVRQVAAQAGMDMTGIPDHFDPQYASGIVSAARALEPPKEASQPNIAKEADYYRSIGRPDLAERLLVNHANPMMTINNGDGTYTLTRPPAAPATSPASTAPAPGTVEDGYRFKGGNPADPSSWEPVNGGPASPAPGGFS